MILRSRILGRFFVSIEHRRGESIEERENLRKKKSGGIPVLLDINLGVELQIMASPISTSGNGYNFKVVLLGEGCVGKTSVALRYVEDKFNDKHMSTLQVKCGATPQGTMQMGDRR